ncbi:MAG: UvrD-helicase domain-containing protein [Schwartzia sp.]|nr:UvrD-helicase domain-containing protein [Schwartzia sp. (in: firmicutes)]
MSEEILSGLNEAQREAVLATEGAVRVVAGAGSGKTRVISRRFAYLVTELGVLPRHILCATFTNKAANVMRARIRRLIGDDDTGYIATFHGFCVSVLKEDSHAVSYPKNFLVVDNADIDAMLARIYEERGLTLRHRTFSDARDMIEIQKTFRRPDYYKDLIAMPLEALREKYMAAQDTDEIIFLGYLWQEKKCFALDYNDLIVFTLHIFGENEAIRQKWQERLEYIMVDEFQDIDDLQYRLLKILAAHHGNLFVVGDPDQTIYTWRGANGRFLLDFDRQYPGAKTILMMENYRSTPEILSAANSLIAKNRDRIEKNLLPTRENGERPVCHHGPNAKEEARWIASKIAELAAGGTKYADIAVLYRAHYVTRALEEAFLDAKIPYVIYSGTPFFARREIKDALSYLRMVVYKDDLSFRRVANLPKRNLGQRRMAFLEAVAEKEGCTLYQALQRNLDDEIFKRTKAKEFVDLVETFAERTDASATELFAAILDASGYERLLRTEGSQERLDNLAELKAAVRDYEETCGEEAGAADFLDHVALFTNSDAETYRDRARLMTIHTAKGLEFPVVFLMGLNEGILPSRKTKTREAMEEERRLAFVAMTRARDRLCLSEAEGLHNDGAIRFPSRFLLDVDKELLDFDPAPADTFIEEARAEIAAKDARLAPPAAPSFAVGQRVRHAAFGDGTVLAIENDAVKVQFDTIKTPRALAAGKLERG